MSERTSLKVHCSENRNKLFNIIYVILLLKFSGEYFIVHTRLISICKTETRENMKTTSWSGLGRAQNMDWKESQVYVLKIL